MDYFPVDGDDDSLPISPDSSSLDALCALNPPSPILTPSQLNFTWSSGDIPVVLYDDAYTQQCSASQVSDAAGSSIRNSSSTLRGSRHSVDSGVVLPASMRTSNRLGSLILNGSESSNTISSAGTFGPKRKSLKPSEPLVPRCVPQVPSSGAQTLPEANTGKRESLVSVKLRSSTQRISGVFANPSVMAALDQTPPKKGNRHSAGNVSEGCRREPGSAQTSCLATEGHSMTSEDWGDSMSETPKKTAAKTASWISSRDWDNRQYKDFLAQDERSRLPPSLHSPEIAHEESDLPHWQVTPTRRKVLERRDGNATPETPRARPPKDTQEQRREKFAHHPSVACPPSFNRIDGDHALLKGITIQFLVDQEGFRAAQPCFKFSGVARLRSSPEVKIPDTLMAQFRPVTRQAFHFHHAPFESPPILRRVTANDDETHDYVSKQVHLTLKSNGVYVVHGHEMFSVDHTSDPMKLHWQFEYLVDDRRVDASKRDMEGEKMLTPLTFSCSPKLMLPAQAKRINIVHIFKKGVAPKLVAEKLQPPGTSRGLAVPACNIVSSETEAHISNFFASKAHAWNLHKRVQSHGFRHPDIPQSNVNNHPVSSSPRSPVLEHVSPESKHSKHRRASSAGENHPSRATARLSTAMTSGRRRDSSTGRAFVHVSPIRHIIPPAQLAELLETESKENLEPIIPDRNSNVFVPLTPRPRHAQHNGPNFKGPF